jgi:hypothetical protein
VWVCETGSMEGALQLNSSPSDVTESSFREDSFLFAVRVS